MEPFGASGNEAREVKPLKEMVGTRRLELLTSTVSTSAWRLPKYTQVVQDIAFCGLGCGLKIWVHTNVICKTSDIRTHDRIALQMLAVVPFLPCTHHRSRRKRE